MRLSVIALMVLTVLPAGAQRAPAAAAQEVIPIVGEWRLDLARTHYGPGVDQRRRERLSCTADERRVSCVIVSVRANGQELVGRFAALVDGSGSPVTGIPDVDEVQLRQPGNALLDATFLSRGRPVFGYRAFRSGDGRSLMIISVDPVSRAVLRSVVMYDRR